MIINSLYTTNEKIETAIISPINSILAEGIGCGDFKCVIQSASEIESYGDIGWSNSSQLVDDNN